VLRSDTVFTGVELNPIEGLPIFRLVEKLRISDQLTSTIYGVSFSTINQLRFLNSITGLVYFGVKLGVSPYGKNRSRLLRRTFGCEE
jgi:hypothetical protein